MKPSRLLLALIGGLLALAIVLGSLPLLGIKLPQTLQPLWWGLLRRLAWGRAQPRRKRPRRPICQRR